MTQGMLKKWIVQTLLSDIEFKTVCITLLGQEVNYYRSPPMNKLEESLPFLAVYSDEYEEDDQSQAQWSEIFEIPMAIAINGEDDSVNDGVSIVWESTDKIEEIAMTAKNVLKKDSFGCGIYGESINLIATSIAISEIGEADDVQATMFLTFGKLNSI